jgi:benzoyl-CoA-dihydrodiol lyase
MGTLAFERRWGEYRHWRVQLAPPTATVILEVDPEGALVAGVTLKSNSYDLGVDIELADIVERLRFEHPEVHAIVLTSGHPKLFSAGANIQMLAGATHHHKVNFCKFTNETRHAIEDASAHSGQVWLAAVNGTASGGGYELALACDEIVLIDDRASAVSFPEVPLLGVLPGTGGLTRLVDKRRVRRDLADAFSTRAEGVKGAQAVDWGLVDAVAAHSRFADEVAERAARRAAESDRPARGPGVVLPPLAGEHARVDIDGDRRAAVLTISGPATAQPATPDEIDGSWWALAAARELDDAVLHLRFDRPEVATIVLRTEGDPHAVLAADDLLRRHAGHWLVREVRLLWGRALSRIDLTAKSLMAVVEPGSCFAGTLAELLLAADRSFMLDGGDPPPTVIVTDTNDGWYPMVNGRSRLRTRFCDDEDDVAAVVAAFGTELGPADAAALGLVTFTRDDLDWDDEVRLALEERASFSPDALTGMEANLRFPGAETMDTKVFARLTAWQNWIFQRPNATGPEGALRRYGTGARPSYDRNRT